VTTTAWSEQELAEIDAHEEAHVASLRSDGSLTSSRTIWAVRLGDEVYVRSVNGPGSAWFRATRARHEGQFSIGTVSKDVTFVDIDETDAIGASIEAAYTGKYVTNPGHVSLVTTDQARSATLKIVPR
jgi:hypothetical protein